VEYRWQTLDTKFITVDFDEPSNTASINIASTKKTKTGLEVRGFVVKHRYCRTK
jgi:hypothetical protein